MTATSTLAYSASSVPTSLRTSGHATPNHGSRSNTPVRIKRLLQAQVDFASAPVAVDLEAGDEGPHVRRSSSAHALEPTAVHRNISSGRRRRLSVTTFGDPEGLTCVDAAPTVLGDVMARRQLMDAALQETTTVEFSASLPVLSLQMRLSDYAVLGPDACVALACSQVADPTVKCVVIFAMPGTTHILAREDVERIVRYSHNPQTDTLGVFLAGTPSVPALYSTASLAGAAGLLLEHPHADFAAIVEDANNGGGGGSTFVGLLSRKDIVRALLGDRSCVFETQPAADPTSASDTAAATVDVTAATAAVIGTEAAAASIGAAGTAMMKPPSALASSASRPSSLASGETIASSGAPSETRNSTSAATSSRHVNVHNHYFSHHNHYYPTSHMAPQGAQVPAPSPRVPTPPSLPPPPQQQQQVQTQTQTQLQHRPGANARQTAATAAAAAATTTMAVVSPAAAAAAATTLPGQLQHQQLPDLTQHQFFAQGIFTEGSADMPSPELLLLPTPAHLFEPSGPLGGAQFSNSPSNSNNGLEHSPAVPEGLKSFADPIKSSWDVLDNMDDALDLLGMLGKTVNAEAMGRKLLGDVMGTVANIAGGSSGTGWLFKYMYDGDCSICRTFQAMLEKLDNGGGRVVFVDISSQAFSPLEHGGINYKAAMETIHILSANGQVFKGVTAVIKLLAAVDPEIASKMGAVTAALPLLSLAYMLISKNRHHLSKAWAQVLRVTKADRALFGRDILAPIPETTQLEGRERDSERGMGMGVGLGSVPPAGLAGSTLGAAKSGLGRGGGGGGGDGEEFVGRIGREPLRSHELQTQPSM